MQAHLVTIVHNLLFLMADWHEQQGVETTAAMARPTTGATGKRTQETGGTLPLIYTLLRRFTQATFELIRSL